MNEATENLIRQHRAKAADFRLKIAATQDAALRVFYESNAIAYETLATPLQLSANRAAEIEEKAQIAQRVYKRAITVSGPENPDTG